MLSLILAVVCFLLYRRVRAKDARRLLMAVLFLAAAWFLWGVVAEVANYLIDDFTGYSVLLVLLLAPLAVLFVAGILITNGLKMFRREGRSLGNSLSGLLGVMLIVLPVAAVALVLTRSMVAFAAALFLFLVSAQAGLSFLVFWTFSKLYARTPLRQGPDAVVVLGSGLIDGQVPPLLAARLDLGCRAFEENRDPGRTVLIPSGGQGPDEPRPEGEAMAEYLVGHGVAPSDVVAETRSRTTEQNLLFSREVADAAEDPGGRRPLLVVTNGYHAPRAALISRKVGVDADVIGAKTARYFVPSAFLREFVAVVKMHRVLHAVIAALSLLASLFLVGVSLGWF